jgi:hypothetical protein
VVVIVHVVVGVAGNVTRCIRSRSPRIPGLWSYLQLDVGKDIQIGICRQRCELTVIRASNSKIFTYCATEPLAILGKCAVRLQAGRALCIADFIVIPGDQPTLLGRSTSENLNLLKVGYEMQARKCIQFCIV